MSVRGRRCSNYFLLSPFVSKEERILIQFFCGGKIREGVKRTNQVGPNVASPTYSRPEWKK